MNNESISFKIFIDILIWTWSERNFSKFALPYRCEGVEVIELGRGERSSSILLKLWRTTGVVVRIGGWNDIALNIGELRKGVNENQNGLEKKLNFQKGTDDF